MVAESDSSSPVALTCISMILCESAHRIDRTGNLILVNVFNVLRLSAFPAHQPRLALLFSLTGGHGKYNLRIAINSATNNVAVIDSTQQIVMKDPLAVVDVIAEMEGVRIPQPGKFWLELHANGELIAQRPFIVAPSAPPRPRPPAAADPPDPTK